MLGMVPLLARGYWDSVLELWLAARLHRKRCTSPRPRLSITRHHLLSITPHLLFMSRQRRCTSGRCTMAIRTIEVIAANEGLGRLGDNYAGGTSISRSAGV